MKMPDPETRADHAGADRDFVASLSHGLSVLAAFGSGREKLTQAEVSAATGLTRSTARRSLLTLIKLGYVRSDAQTYELTPKVLELAGRYLSNHDGWLAVVKPYLEQLRNRISENVSAVVLDGTEIVYVSVFPVDRAMVLNAKVGQRKPAYATAAGRVLLSRLPEECAGEVLKSAERLRLTDRTVTDIGQLMAEIRKIREQGFALVGHELERGLIAVSVPILNVKGDCLAAINVCGHVMYSSLDDMMRVALPETAKIAMKLKTMLR